MRISLKNLLPVNFMSAGNHQLVELIRADMVNFAPGFFHQAMRNIVSRKEATQIMALDQWRAAEYALSGTADFKNTTFIFHVGRCGSTLLCQNLKSNGKCLVLGEPAFLGSGCGGTAFDDRLDEVPAQIIQAWQRWAVDRGQQLVVKLSSKDCRNIAKYRKLYPSALLVALTRDPLPVIESQSRNPSRYLQKKLAKTRNCDESFVTLAAHEYNTAVTHIGHALNEGLVHIDYGKLPEFFADLLKLLEIEPVNNSITWNAEFQAKERQAAKLPYQPVSAEMLATFYHANAELIDKLRETYHEAIGPVL